MASLRLRLRLAGPIWARTRSVRAHVGCDLSVRQRIDEHRRRRRSSRGRRSNRHWRSSDGHSSRRWHSSCRCQRSRGATWSGVAVANGVDCRRRRRWRALPSGGGAPSGGSRNDNEYNRSRETNESGGETTAQFVATRPGQSQRRTLFGSTLSMGPPVAGRGRSPASDSRSCIMTRSLLGSGSGLIYLAAKDVERVIHRRHLSCRSENRKDARARARSVSVAVTDRSMTDATSVTDRPST